ncbi:MAG: hypothetical protein LBC86_09215 [Oscillospiraceae bacterium]|jgi:hypothetical protein|nr:hypothetical protein [Oscillospiraceae bacterium]
MERLQKKLSVDAILSDRDLMLLAVLLILLFMESADLPLMLAIAYVFLF